MKRDTYTQTSEVGDLVRVDSGGEFPKKGIIWKVTDVRLVEPEHWQLDKRKYWQYKLKPFWALFDAHKNKKSF